MAVISSIIRCSVVSIATEIVKRFVWSEKFILCIECAYFEEQVSFCLILHMHTHIRKNQEEWSQMWSGFRREKKRMKMQTKKNKLEVYQA